MEVLYKNTLKNTNVFNKILTDVKAARLKHAYLVAGNDPSALKGLVTLAAAAMYCHNKNACLECAGCRGVLNKSNPDIKFYQGVNKDTAAEIVGSVTERPYGGAHKTYLITDFNMVREDNQNKLLKTLEEPSADTVFVLSASGTAGVLPTIKSRCEVMELYRLDERLLADELQTHYPEVSADDINAAVMLGGVNISGAERLLDGGEYGSIIELAYRIVTQMKKSPQILEYAALVLKYKGQSLVDFINVLALIMRDILAHKSGSKVLFARRLNDIISVSAEFSVEACVKIIDRINHALKRLDNNGNPISVTDELLFSFLEVKALCR